MINASDLRNAEITEVDLGYSKDEVKVLINSAAEAIEQSEAEKEGLYHKLEVLAAKIEEYRAEEDSIKTALITAQKMADRIKKESAEEAEKLVSDSKASAEAAVSEARAQADKIISEAREFSSSLINQKTQEAEAIVAEAEKKSNEAINSSQIVAQNILDQAKEISDELVQKSQEEKEAYALLNATLRRNAAVFIDNLKNLYSEQLDALNNAKLFSSDEAQEAENLSSVQTEVNSLVGEIDEMKSAIPTEVKVEAPEYTEPEPEEEEAEEIIEEPEEEPEEEAEEIIEEIIDEPAETPEDEDGDDPDLPDPMEAVEAFSNDKITPIDKSKPAVPEIDEEPEMEEKSLFEEKLPFENYFHVKTEDAHLDKTQTISLIPPEDDDDDDAPKFKGFFKKKK